MHRIAEGVEDAQDVQGDPGIGVPDIGDWDAEILGEGARAVDTHALGIFT